jgi:hypothetical protein
MRWLILIGVGFVMGCPKTNPVPPPPDDDEVPAPDPVPLPDPTDPQGWSARGYGPSEVRVYRDEDEDHLMRQIRQFIEALAAHARGESRAQVQVDELVREAIGLKLRTLDLLSVDALASLGASDDPRWGDRMELMAVVLEQLAEREPEGAEERREKAWALRQLVAEVRGKVTPEGFEPSLPGWKPGVLGL